jgi:hypothetical protein
MMKRKRHTTLCSAALCIGIALMTGSSWARITSSVSPVIQGLNGPRGLAVGPAGRLIYAENDGSFSELIGRGRNTGTGAPLGAVPATFIAPAVGTSGGRVFVLTAGGPPGSGAATLYRGTPGRILPLADIGAYQVTDPDPYNLADDPGESNPFGVAPLPDGSILVSDAAANDLLRVYPNGSIVTVARLKPRVVAVPDELPDTTPEGDPLPPGGTLLPSEAVATSVTVGADGYYYVGELRGFPATPGKSQIWRIAPGSVNAVCDPIAPSTGPCQRYADGFTSIVALAAGADGSIYVVQLVQNSWLQWEYGLTPPVGGLYRIPPGGGTPVELAGGSLILPAGVAIDELGTPFVTTPVFGPGSIVRID